MKTLKKEHLKSADALKGKVRQWASKIGVQPKRVQIQHMTKKWASCSTTGRICLSADLLWEDAAFQDIVIVHELLHLQVPNHGKLFNSLMKAYLPKWVEAADGRTARMCAFRDPSEILRRPPD